MVLAKFVVHDKNLVAYNIVDPLPMQIQRHTKLK
jgi:hypothetical protein